MKHLQQFESFGIKSIVNKFLSIFGKTKADSLTTTTFINVIKNINPSDFDRIRYYKTSLGKEIQIAKGDTSLDINWGRRYTDDDIIKVGYGYRTRKFNSRVGDLGIRGEYKSDKYSQQKYDHFSISDDIDKISPFLDELAKKIKNEEEVREDSKRKTQSQEDNKKVDNLKGILSGEDRTPERSEIGRFHNGPSRYPKRY